MRHAALLVAFLATACREEPLPPSPPEIAMAEEPPDDDGDFDPRGGRLARGKPDGPVVALRLRDGGLLQTRVGDGWKDATLDDVSRILAATRDRNPKEISKDDFTGGSGVFVSIEAEPKVPWQHVLWLLCLAAEENYTKLHLTDGRREMLAFVPSNAAIEWIPERLPPYVVLQIDVIPRAGVTAPWDGTTVLRPTKVACRASAVRYGARGRMGDVVAGLETRDDAGPWLARARAAANEIPRVRIVGQIRAANTVPFATVFDVMETFVDSGSPEVNLFDELLSIPSKAVRSMPRLPYPKRTLNPPVAPPPEDD